MVATSLLRSPEPLVQTLAGYLPAGDVETVRRAYDFAVEAHGEQTRKSGEPYVNHPLAAAETLAELHMDPATIVAALLHDVPEDTGFGLAEVEARFGPEVAKLVDGVTKLTKLRWLHVEDGRDGGREKRRGDDQAEWAENMRKMFLAMADDIRVVLIKLADRLHNMRTLDALEETKRRRIAQETLDIYAPLANRLGIWQVKWQLEDLAFRHLHPTTYKEIASKLEGRRQAREEYISRVIDRLGRELEAHGVKAELSGRPKHIYSIWRKMERRSADIGQIYDLLAVRVLVETMAECYQVLGVVHQLWHPLPGQFDDYISNPKESLYQALHTTVMGLDGRPLEIQIRTHEMHRVAEYGVAAHWRYKEGLRQDVKFDAKVAWLRQLMDWQKDVVGGAQEFVDSLKTDVFREQVSVFTPRGEVKELPSGATPLDFAYRVHTEVGNKCVGAKVNGRMVSLDYRLRNGDIVEIVTARGSRGPSRDWLNPHLGYVKTANAREKIRQWFRKQQRHENIAHGRDQIEKELKRLGLESFGMERVATMFRYEKVDDFFAAVGYGDISSSQVAARLETELQREAAEERTPTTPASMATTQPARGIRVLGVGDLLTRLARCCNPVPGDDIVGYITRGKGVTVHRTDCASVLREEERDRLIQVDWGQTAEHVYPVPLRLECWDRVGLVRDVAAIVADEKINMTSVNTLVHGDGTATVLCTLEVSGLQKLSRVLNRLEAMPDVFEVVREVNRAAASAR
jgi:GTP pyrophosphokinase